MTRGRSRQFEEGQRDGRAYVRNISKARGRAFFNMQ
jgi:hypothetical protein